MADDKVALEIFIEADKAQMSLGDLEAGFDSMKERLKNVGRGSEEFKELSTAMAQTTGEIKNIELGFEGLGKEEIASQLGSVAGGVGDVTASLVLMGGENETIEQMAASIETAMAISMGFKGAIEGGASAMKLYNNLVKTGKLQTILYSTATKVAAVAQRVLNAVMKANPIMLIVGAILAAVAAYKLFTSETEEATFAQKAFTEASEEAQKATVKEKIELDQLIKVAKDDTLSKKQRQAAIEELNKLAPDYLGNLTLETINTESATAAIDGYVKSLESKARATALQNKLVEIETSLIDANNQSAEEQASLASTALKLSGNFVASELNANQEKVNKIANLEKEKQAILGLLEAENQYTDEYVGNASEREAADKAAADEAARLAKEKAERDKAAQKAWEDNADNRAMARSKESQAKKDALMEDIEIANRNLELNTEELDTHLIHIEGLKTNEEILRDAKARWHEEDLARIEAEKQAKIGKAQDVLQKMEMIGQAIMDIDGAVRDNAIAAIDLKYNNEKKKGTLTAKQEFIFAKQKDAILKKHFERQKKMNIAMAAINMAQSIASAMTNPWPLNLFLAASAAVTGGVQINAIKNQQFSGSAQIPPPPSIGDADSPRGADAGGGVQLSPVSNTSTILGDQQVFVTETDITDTQNNVSVIEESATF